MKKFITMLAALVVIASSLTVLSSNADYAQADEITINNNDFIDEYIPGLSDGFVEFSDGSIQPYASDFGYSSLSISSKKARMESSAGPISGVTKIEAIQCLQIKNGSFWLPALFFKATSNSDSLYAVNYSGELTSGTYRLKTKFTFYWGSESSGPVEVYSNEATV